VTVAIPVNEKSERIVVVGQGYVGLPLAMRAVEVGFDVVGLDVSESRIAGLAAGRSYVEDVTDAQLRAALASGHYVPTADYQDTAGFAVAVITVPTPLRDRSPDVSFIADAGRQLSPYVTPGSLVVLESTTYPGTTEDLLRPVLEADSGLAAGEDFLLAYSPERIDPGNTEWNLETTPKIVAGLDQRSLNAAAAFYGKITHQVVPVSTLRAAECAKLLENTYRHVNIALVNELAIFARELGVDIWEVIDAAATKPFGFMRFTPGPGVGGHCLPIDPAYLSWHVKQATGRNFRLVELACDVNEHMPDYVVQRVTLALNARQKPVRGSSILVVGLAYKKNSSDARESPATRVVELLGELGARVSAADALVSPHHLAGQAERVEITAPLLAEADAVLLLTSHDDVDYDLIQQSAPWVLDCCHRLRGDNIEHL
jgi:UDP-N-acetyl-D-glucosamine dehydrogenase